ncbi:MAG TPA: phosphoglycerate mutase family protein [Gemmatimonadaceae bacterium]|nr:phosphoglycerate mutase family protein [Gemmatimonadaceae bacterium]
MPRPALPALPRRASTLVALAVLIAVFLAPGANAQTVADERPVTVIIARHAERATTDPRDPPLAENGWLRAAALRDAIRDAGVTAVYVTQYRRTAETAEPIAGQLGLTPIVLGSAGDVAAHAAEVAATLLARHRGEVVLVVGHSNTIGAIARALGGEAPASLEDGDYDNLYVVTADGRGPARIVRARYGPPNPDGP